MSPDYSDDKQCHCGYFCAFHLLYIRLTLELYTFSILLDTIKLLCNFFLQFMFCECVRIPMTLSSTLVVIILFIFCQTPEYKIVYHCGFNLQVLITSEVRHFSCLLATSEIFPYEFIVVYQRMWSSLKRGLAFALSFLEIIPKLLECHS